MLVKAQLLKGLAYEATVRGVLPNKGLNLSFPEAVSVYKSLIHEHCVDLSLAVLHKGSYRLLGSKAKFVVSESSWERLNNDEKTKRLSKLDNYYRLNSYNGNLEDAWPSYCVSLVYLW